MNKEEAIIFHKKAPQVRGFEFYFPNFIFPFG